MKDVCATLLPGCNEFSSLKIKMRQLRFLSPLDSKLRCVMSELHPMNYAKSVDGKVTK